MKNNEKYADEIREYKGVNFCNDFVMPNILKLVSCHGDCAKCRTLQMIWPLEEYEEPKEPEIDWSKVEVDTPMLVKAIDNDKWNQRYFAKYKDGVVYAWDGGKTSWNKDCMTSWKYAKLAESEEE